MPRSREMLGLIREARGRGFRVKETRNGFTIYAKNGVDTVGTHASNSDRRAVKKLRSDLKRIGVFDR